MTSKRARQIRNLRLWGPVGVYMGMIFALSAQSALPSVPVLNLFDWSDKVIHFVEYAGLGALVWRALGAGMPKWRRLAASVAIATLYGLSDEIHQLYVPGRSYDLLDLLADALGATTAAGLLTRVIRD